MAKYRNAADLIRLTDDELLVQLTLAAKHPGHADFLVADIAQESAERIMRLSEKLAALARDSHRGHAHAEGLAHALAGALRQPAVYAAEGKAALAGWRGYRDGPRGAMARARAGDIMPTPPPAEHGAHEAEFPGPNS